MKIILPILLNIFAIFPVHAIESKDLLGEWKYSGFIYEKIIYPPPNPDLYLSFTFKAESSVRLFWKRQDEDFFCERVALFSVSDTSILSQNIIWVNPDNHSSCSSDPDMQLGRKTDNYVEIVNKELHLFLELDGKPFIYILTKVPAAGTSD